MKKFYLAFILSLASLLAIPQQALAALAIGASAQGAGSGTALPTSAVTTQTTGSTFVVFVSDGNPPTYLAPTDNKGNTYSLTPNQTVTFNSPFGGGAVWVCQNCAGGAGHIFTANFTGSTSAIVIAVEITSTGGIWGTLDQSASTSGLANVTTANSPSITPTVNGEVVLSFVAGAEGTNTTITDATGYNNILQVNAAGATNGNPVAAVGGFVQTTLAATSDVFTLGASTNAGTVTLSFKLSTGGASAALAGAASDTTSATGALTTTAPSYVQILLDNAGRPGGSDNIFLGTGPNTGTGDPANVAFPKLKQWAADLNTMIAQVYPNRSLQTPTTGFSIAPAANITQLILNPAGTLATGTVAMPRNPGDGQPFALLSSQTVTALTVNTSDGATINGAPTTISANTSIKYRFVLSLNTWFRE
jgi:hypothetical protein